MLKIHFTVKGSFLHLDIGETTFMFTLKEAVSLCVSLKAVSCEMK